MAKGKSGLSRLHYFIIALAICWTISIAASLIWNTMHMPVNDNLLIVIVIIHFFFLLTGLAVITMGGWRQMQTEDHLRKSNQELLKNSSESKNATSNFTNILDNIDVGFIVVDRNYKLRYANRVFCNKFNIQAKDVIGEHCYKISHRIDKPCHEAGEECGVRMAFETGVPHTVVHTHYDDGDTPFCVQIHCYPIKNVAGEVVSVIEMTHDITEEKVLELQSSHSHRSDSVRQLAGGMSHGFNNVLSVIVNYANIVLMKMSDEDQKNNMQHILTAADKAASLTRNLLIYSGKQPLDPKTLELNEIVINDEKNIQELIGEDVELKSIMTDEKLIIMADSVQLKQVLWHLAENAKDAMPYGGKLLIKTEVVDIDSAFQRMHGYGEPGKYAILSLTDTGDGMDRETMDRIFEPFFSTKETNAGGLTLAIVYRIIEQHNGYINVYSEMGKGTSIKIYLPLILKNGFKNSRQKPAASSEPVAVGTETLLLAENDDSIREVTKYLLEEFGYKVIEAVDGADAVAKFRDHKDNIQLLILDMMMPKINGKDAYKEILKYRSDIKAIFQSGYSVDFLKEKDMFVDGIEYISKPIPPTELQKKIREVLDK